MNNSEVVRYKEVSLETAWTYAEAVNRRKLNLQVSVLANAGEPLVPDPKGRKQTREVKAEHVLVELKGDRSAHKQLVMGLRERSRGGEVINERPDSWPATRV